MLQSIITTLSLFYQKDDVFEVRVLDAARPGYKYPHIECGYFDYEHIEDVHAHLSELTDYMGVYITINPVNPALLARASNRLVRAKKGATTSDADILCRRWLFIDIDAVRPSGISATDAEKALAYNKLVEVKDGLASMGFSEPVVVDSGNGYYLMYRIDLAADSELVSGCLHALSVCSDDKVHIDTSVSNAARICRLPGTWNRKGDNLPDRPHRLSELLEVPEEIRPTPIEIINGLAEKSQPKQKPLPQPVTRKEVRDARSFDSGNGNVADDYNSRAQIEPLLVAHGWTLLGDSGGNQQWRRPGKDAGRLSANYDGRVFYVFSSAAQPFEANKGYSRFGVYAALEHNNDFAAANRALEADGYGARNNDMSVDISGILAKCGAGAEKKTSKHPFEIVEEMPDDYCRIPGFVSELMDFCMETAPHPNQKLAFCGALSLLSFLVGRKVRDPGNIRPNLYLLALANSGTGKDWPRKINAAIINHIGRIARVGDEFASAEGLEDAMMQNLCMLFQIDEMDALLKNITNSMDGRGDMISKKLLTFYTSADSIYSKRAKAGQKESLTVKYPHLSIFGTAIPKNYYQSLSENLLTNGLFSRMIILDSGKRSRGKLAGDFEAIPEGIIKVASYWNDLMRSKNLQWEHPDPQVIERTDAATQIMVEFKSQCDDRYEQAELVDDIVEQAIWTRAHETASKLALLYACSNDCHEPVISEQAASWAVKFASYQVRRQLYLTNIYSADNEFHGKCLKLKDKLRTAKDKQLARSALLKKMKMDKDSFNKIIDTLLEQGDIKEIVSPTAGRKSVIYVLAE